MQPNVITLPVDTLNNGTPTDESYTRYDAYQNRATYIGASHTADSRDTLTLYRTFPTKNANFKGVMKTSVKFSKDIAVAGVDSSTSLTAPIIFEVNCSIPVGATDAEILLARQRLIALLDLDSVMVPLNSQQMV